MGRKVWDELVEQSRLAALGKLCGGVAHELSNPLAYVLTNLRYLKEELPGILERKPSAAELTDVEETLADALEGATRVADLVAELRAFARAESMSREPVDLCALLDRACTLAKTELAAASKVQKDYEGTPTAWANPAKVLQVIVTLLSHAGRALPSEGIRSIRLGCKSSGSGRVELSVHFTAQGQTLAALDGPLESSESIDLVVCRSLVESLGGAMRVELSETETALVVALPTREKDTIPTRAA